MLLSSAKLANAMRSFLLTHSPSPIEVRIILHVLPLPTPDPPSMAQNSEYRQMSAARGPCPDPPEELHIVFFPEETFMLAKMCWDFSGHGITSRRADQCLELLGVPSRDPVAGLPPHASSFTPETAYNDSPGGSVESLPDGLCQNQTTRLVQCDEQPLPYAEAKSVLRRRIARALEGDFTGLSETLTSVPNDSGSGTLSDDDVFLYLNGMNAIWHAHQLILQTTEKLGKVAGKSICFG